LFLEHILMSLGFPLSTGRTTHGNPASIRDKSSLQYCNLHGSKEGYDKHSVIQWAIFIVSK